jgi:hypothetical protein
MVNLRTLFTLRIGKERPSLAGVEVEKSHFRKDRRGDTKRGTEKQYTFLLLKENYFAEYYVKNTNSKIVQ